MAWRIVITHLYESLDWVRAVVPNGTEVWVYHKGVAATRVVHDPSWRWVVVPNIGREAETVARHLFEEYDALAPLTAFLQGNPEHGGALSMLGAAMSTPNATGCGVLGAPILSSQADGCPHHCGLAIRATCERLRLPRCAAPFRFVAGGMFFVSRERARHLRREQYARMVQQLRSDARYDRRAPLYPYIYERLWKRFFECV